MLDPFFLLSQSKSLCSPFYPSTLIATNVHVDATPRRDHDWVVFDHPLQTSWLYPKRVCAQYLQQPVSLDRLDTNSPDHFMICDSLSIWMLWRFLPACLIPWGSVLKLEQWSSTWYWVWGLCENWWPETFDFCLMLSQRTNLLKRMPKVASLHISL